MIELPKLLYPQGALEPVLTKEQIHLHYEKHHKAYVTNLNKLIKDTEFEDMELTKIVLKAGSGPIFNNAAQAYNHNQYWLSLTPQFKSKFDETSKFAKQINADFTTFDHFKKEAEEKAKKFFGSGWLFLVQRYSGKLDWITLRDAHNPLGKEDVHEPLLTIDLWEHAWYVSYPAERAKYMEKIWSIINWDFANKQYTSDL